MPLRLFIALDSTESAVISLLAKAHSILKTWLAERQQRMERLISELNYFESSDTRLTQAIRWNILTLDQLITRQTGYGIYAGLPWFNDYWGRDLFISLPWRLPGNRNLKYPQHPERLRQISEYG